MMSYLDSGNWLVSAASQQGYAHIRDEIPNQDFHAIDMVKDFEGESLVLAVADGAGSAPFSDEGSRIAAKTTVERLVHRIRKRPVASVKNHLIRSELRNAVKRSRSEISQYAKKEGKDSRDFATTLLAAVINEKTLATIHIGDGAIIIKGSTGEYRVVSEPQGGEYANETYFITSQNFPKAKITITSNPDVAAIFLITDGIQPLAVIDQNDQAHPGFFDPILNTVLSDNNPKQTAVRINEFISSERVRQRIIDDVTLVVAVAK